MFDKSQRPFGIPEWHQLADEIHNERIEESSWLECKNLKLTNKNHIAKIAKAIVGFANRDPHQAEEDGVGGYGILIVGLSARVAEGVARMDVTDLENKLNAYLSEEHSPRWEHHWFEYQSVTLLAIVVAPPKTGDLIYAIYQGQGDDTLAGQVLVRRGSRTVPITPNDLKRLTERANPPAQEASLEIALSFLGEYEIPSISFNESQLDIFLQSEEANLLKALPSVQRAKASDMFAVFASASRITPNETRSEEAYRSEVSDYLSRIRKIIPNYALERAASMVQAPRIVATNLGNQVFERIRVTLTIEGPLHAHAKTDEEPRSLKDSLPRRPVLYGAQNLYLDTIGRLAIKPLISVPWLGRKRITQNTEGVYIDLDEFELRSGETNVCIDDATSFLALATTTETINVRWEATAANVNGRAHGVITVPIAKTKPIELSDFLTM